MIIVLNSCIFHLVPTYIFLLKLAQTGDVNCSESSNNDIHLFFQIPAIQITSEPDLFSQTPVSLVLKSFSVLINPASQRPFQIFMRAEPHLPHGTTEQTRKI